MKRKIEHYLNTKEKSEYNNLDKIFKLYLSGDIKKLLSKYVGVSICPTINKLGKTIQLNYNYHNIYVIVDFFEEKYNIVVSYPGINEDDLDKFSIDYDYQNDFDLEKLIKQIDEKIKNHPKLKDTTLIEKKEKLYSLIAWISLYLPIVIWCGIGLYCVITESSVRGNIWWEIFFIVIPLIVWFTFSVKSKKTK